MPCETMKIILHIAVIVLLLLSLSQSLFPIPIPTPVYFIETVVSKLGCQYLRFLVIGVTAEIRTEELKKEKTNFNHLCVSVCVSRGVQVLLKPCLHLTYKRHKLESLCLLYVKYEQGFTRWLTGAKYLLMIFFAYTVGSLVRASAAAGCELFVTSKGCVDVWEPKVLRCAAGGHFHLPIHYHLPWNAIQEVIPDGSRIIVAESCEEGYT